MNPPPPSGAVSVEKVAIPSIFPGWEPLPPGINPSVMGGIIQMWKKPTGCSAGWRKLVRLDFLLDALLPHPPSAKPSLDTPRAIAYTYRPTIGPRTHPKGGHGSHGTRRPPQHGHANVPNAHDGHRPLCRLAALSRSRAFRVSLVTLGFLGPQATKPLLGAYDCFGSPVACWRDSAAPAP